MKQTDYLNCMKIKLIKYSKDSNNKNIQNHNFKNQQKKLTKLMKLKLKLIIQSAKLKDYSKIFFH